MSAYSQASPEHLQQCVELAELRNSSLRPLAVEILAIPFARWTGASVTDAYRLAGIYTGAFSRGTNRPICRSSNPPGPSFAINLKTAKALGLDISPMLLALADEVIE